MLYLRGLQKPSEVGIATPSFEKGGGSLSEIAAARRTTLATAPTSGHFEAIFAEATAGSTG
jgi:hypothetical protein